MACLDCLFIWCLPEKLFRESALHPKIPWTPSIEFIWINHLNIFTNTIFFLIYCSNYFVSVFEITGYSWGIYCVQRDESLPTTKCNLSIFLYFFCFGDPSWIFLIFFSTPYHLCTPIRVQFYFRLVTPLCFVFFESQVIGIAKTFIKGLHFFLPKEVPSKKVSRDRVGF